MYKLNSVAYTICIIRILDIPFSIGFYSTCCLGLNFIWIEVKFYAMVYKDGKKTYMFIND